MRVRCGSCRAQFEVPGAGRFECPVCRSVNAVRDSGADPAPSTVGGYQTAPGVGGEAGAPPPPPPPDAPLPKVQCPECGFEFIVGRVPAVTCPNCSSQVATGIEPEAEVE